MVTGPNSSFDSSLHAVSILWTTSNIVTAWWRARGQQILHAASYNAKRNVVFREIVQWTLNKIFMEVSRNTQKFAIVLLLRCDVQLPIVHLTWLKIPSISRRLNYSVPEQKAPHQRWSRGISRHYIKWAQNVWLNIFRYVSLCDNLYATQVNINCRNFMGLFIS